jgi:N-acetylglucosamine-6-phosphate deacetylase
MNIQGFVDLHTHGISRYDTRTDDHEEILSMARVHA